MPRYLNAGFIKLVNAILGDSHEIILIDSYEIHVNFYAYC